MALSHIIRSEVSQKEKDHFIHLYVESKIQHKRTYLHIKQKQTYRHRKQIYGCQERGLGEGRVGCSGLANIYYYIQDG